MKIEVEVSEERDESRRGARIEKSGWALFLIMVGVLWMAPDGSFPEGLWLIGSGVILLAVQLFRGLFGLTVSGGTLILGILALGLGFGDMFGFSIPVFPALLVLLGIYMLFELLFKVRD
ncbi:hypothetical protein H8E52_10025 [bacterium]|nr:hypothetical protein [bacterium]